MPYKSKKQARKFHAMEARGQISPSTVKEFDQATNFASLPDQVVKKAAKDRNANRRKMGGGHGTIR